MPYIGIGLHVLAAIYFAVHAIRSGQSLYWLILLFSFPLLGSIVYFLAIYFPEARNSRGARQAIRSAKQLMDPGQDLRNARAELARTPTVQNRVRLGMTLLDAGQAEEARTLLEQAASSPLGDDPYILTGLARARLDSGQATVSTPPPPARACGGDAGRPVRPPFGCAPQAGTDPALRAGTGGCPSARHPRRVRASRGMRKRCRRPLPVRRVVDGTAAARRS